MDPTAAGEVLWLRAVESTAHPSFTEHDAEQASRSALQAVGEAAPPQAFIAQRAHFALQRMAQRTPAAAPALTHAGRFTLGRGPWLLGAMLLGLLAGLLADQIGSRQRINLLAPPVWALIVWNLAVYAGLLWHAIAPAGASPILQRAIVAWQRRWRESRLNASRRQDGMAAVWADFVPAWSRYTAPLVAARVALCLHAAAATLALGMMGGMYLRGLVLDYRVAWESTFLQADTVQRVLSTMLAPASALTGLALPGVAEIRALQVQPGAAPGTATTPSATTSAAAWIHLYAAQLLLFAVLPRTALAFWAGRQARGLAGRFPLDADDPYFQRLRAEQRGETRHVSVWPYAHTPDALSQAGLLALVQQAFGADTDMRLAATVAFGGEDDARPAPAAGEMALALFDLSATPEAENHGRFVQSLRSAAQPHVLMLVDQAAFARRFDAQRLQQRRQAWQALADSLGVNVVFVDLQSPDLAAARSALHRQGSP